ncbi:thiol:disulfide interchange protein DsbA [Candidatus Palibaumannia cicadellinicola]|uniref:Thiol:disulfide interchange protein n=1 Tax=Candidatus Palibaumannia cicadellinicola TaxID=186490 RepID=A0A0K2BKU4_9GAMM|nr:thiol:disulfide interchange protein DsbA [Candidatus Baumannia cicadellinicola]AKZ65812.1 Periplasmic thiol:disulfide interchange protein DsbA [Candidatus Baumannia cicadellinicola]
MKFFVALIISITLVSNTSAVQFTEGKEYICLNRPATSEPQVIEFFSFYCQHCYKFSNIYNIDRKLKKSLPYNIKVKKYHVNYLGPLSKQLTKAWAVAIQLGVEDKVRPIIFYGVQYTQYVKTTNDIRTMFIKAGVSAKEYDAAWNSCVVQTLQKQQEKAATELKLSGVPAMVINGKYMVKYDGLDITSSDVYIKQLSDVVNYLLTKPKHYL